MSIAFIGTGNMGGALLRGVLAGGTAPDSTVATTGSTAAAESLATELGIRALSLEADPDANRTAVAGARFVFTGVKPAMLSAVLDDVADALDEHAVVVSMAAGVDIATIQRSVPGHPVVRIMPNTPSSIGHGVIALAPDPAVPTEAIADLTELLRPVGLVVPIEERHMSLLTGISGSGVAYFFLLAEHLVSTAVEQGLAPEVAERAIAATAEGAGRLLAETPDPRELRESVTSKGGTTAAAIGSFESDGFAGLVSRAVAAAVDRAQEMEAENRGSAQG